jgi:heparinase II/III-like protein
MDRAELWSRASARCHIAWDRARATISPPRWERGQLLGRLSDDPALAPIRRALSRGEWLEAHHRLSRHFAGAPARFPLAPSRRSTLPGRIRHRHPDSTADATVRADRVVAGEYDLLGYQRLRFADAEAVAASSVLPDWHFDPVHRRRAPSRFWSTIDYLNADCGDHKVIWELNRHQHWLTLGRAYWLSNDERYRDRFCAELDGWMRANPPLIGINWASMLELALRSLSWLWALHLFVIDPAGDEFQLHGRDEQPWTLDVLLGIDRQLTLVERNLSRYFSPNTHLLGEALALYVAGRALPELAASARWTTIGREVLRSELDRQFTADGGHAERSTHYHRYALDFYLLALIVARITQDPAATDFEEPVARVAAAARLLADDWGRLPHIGDDDGGMLFPMTGRLSDDITDSLAIAAELLGRPELRIGTQVPEEALWMLDREFQIPPATGHIPSAALLHTGYCVSRSKTGDHLVIDGGPHGYQNAGHAHADALSLTLSVRGLPLLVDPGTFCYTTDPRLRDRFRSSTLHNTLTLDNRSQSIARGPFHWTHMARGRIDCWRTNDQFDYFDGSHDGYRPVEHRRHVLVLHGDLLVVADLVDGEGSHSAAVHWHVHPDWRVEVHNRQLAFDRVSDRSVAPGADGGSGSAASLDRISMGLLADAFETVRGNEESGLGWYSPVYGQRVRLTTVRVTRTAVAPFWLAAVFDLSGRQSIHQVDLLRIHASDNRTNGAAALRIDRGHWVDYVAFTAANRNASCEAVTLEHSRRVAQMWRIGDIETDARMLFYRIDGGGSMTRFAVVDGSTVRTSTGRTHLALSQSASDLHVDSATCAA